MKKSRIAIYIFWIILLITIVISLITGSKNNSDETRKETFNIINSQSNNYNEVYKGYVYYRPSGFQQTYQDNLLKLTDNRATMIVHFGTGVTSDYQIYTKLNPDKEKLYEYVNEDNLYLIIWDYDSDYNLIFLGQNDRYIEALVPKDEENKYLLICAQVFASIKEESEYGI